MLLDINCRVNAREIKMRLFTTINSILEADVLVISLPSL